jgi:amino acid adenylation domain-containing protein/non-ribosomal peptide synthase protein (TIGR01720 family)
LDDGRLDGLQARLARFSPEKRELLLKKLQERRHDDRAGDRRDDDHVPALGPIAREQPIPLSFAQARLWFLDQLEGESTDYRVPILWRLTGRLHQAALEQAIAAIVERHEVLRTIFPLLKGSPVQVIHPAGSMTLPVIDLQSLPEAEQQIKVQHLATTEARRPFDLAIGPLLRATLLRLSDESHALVVVVHHIVCDGWSVGIFRHELSALYTSFCAGEPSPLPALSIQFADYAHWQRGWLQGETLAAQLAYWQAQLSGAPPLLELPTDRPRPSVQSFRGGSAVFQLDQALTQELKRMSQRAGATLFMTLLACFALLLSRYSRQEDIVIGSPIANRNHRKIEPLIGCFMNTMVLRVALHGDPTFLELLARVRQVALDAYEHQDLPFEKLVDELQPARSLSYNPLFQVMFAFQNVPMKDLQLPGLAATPLPWENVTTHFDLSLTMKETAQGLIGELEYSSDLFDVATIVRMMGHFQTLLKGVAVTPAQPVSTFSLLTAAERCQLLVEWSAAPAAYTLDACVHQLFERQVERTPDAIAVIDHSSAAASPPSLTYQELNDRSNRLAHHLRTLGVGVLPDTLVGLFVERSLEMIVGLFGILKAGGAYVPLDPGYPTERLTQMIQDAGVRVLVTAQRFSEVVISHPVRSVFLDSQEIARQSAENLRGAARPTDLAYVIYTSGSTGQPKGVMIEHRALANLARAAVDVYGISANDRVLQFATINFDVSVEEINSCLISGATLVLRSDDMLDSVPAFLQRAQEWAVTVWNLPTAYWHLLCREMASAGRVLPASLRLVIVGGERLLPERVRQWLALAGTSSRLMNGYGPTEATVTATVCDVSGLSSAGLPAREVPIGRPIGNTEVYVLDKARQPVPIGVAGELCIGGGGLARGYLGDPGSTQEKFVAHPFSAEPGARLYKTGDLAYFLADGNLAFLGRLDDQVKIRGFRVEPGDIEAALRQHPYVSEAVVIAREDAPGDDRPSDAPPSAGHKRLLAYVVPWRGQPTAAELRRFLEQKLPNYMIPGAFILLSALPLTANGKIDHGALPSPDPCSESDAAFIEPRTPMEAQLAAIWAEILSVKRVGIHDKFFDLGGDSILGVQMVTRANQAGLSLSTRQIFQHQTIALLARAVGTVRRVQAQQGILTGGVPLTPVQHAFFEIEQIEPHFFNLSLLLETPADLRPDFLEQAVQTLLAHHDALRLRFVWQGDHWRQSYSAIDEGAPFKVVDLSSLIPEEQPAAMKEMDHELQASLNLSTGPIARVALFRLGEDRAGRLLLIVHHLAMDIVSWWILIEDLMTAYQQLCRGEAMDLPPKTTSYQEWAYRLADYAQSDALAAEVPYWLTSSGSDVAPLPVDYPPCRGNNVFACLDRVSVALSEKETRALLQDLPSIYKTQIDDVLLTAFVRAVNEWTGERALLVELANHGREMPFEDVDLSRTVGWFVAEYPVLLAIEEASEPLRALERVREQLRRVPRRGVGYGMLRYLRRDKAIRKKLQVLPRPQVTFTYFGQYEKMLRGEPLWGFAKEARPSFYSPSTNRDRYLLNVHAVSMAGRMQINWTYSKKVHRRETVERLAASMLDHLKVLISHDRSAAR